MRCRRLIVIASFLMVLGCGKNKSEIEGTWTVVSVEKDPALDRGPSKEQWTGGKFTFTGDKYTMEAGERKSEGTLKVVSNQDMKGVQLTGSGSSQMQGIYKLNGNELTLCVTSGKGVRPPKEFSAKKGSRAVLLVLKRE